MASSINKDTLFPYLMYSQPISYGNFCTIYPVLMRNILDFNAISKCITVRKDSRFPNKEIIKMTYLDFLLYAALHPEIAQIYEYEGLDRYYTYAYTLLSLVCKDDKVDIEENTASILINDHKITPSEFDDIRRIIILQNDMDFDIDEFLNYDTEKRLEKARKDLSKDVDSATMEDYIDSMMVALHLSEDEIMQLSIRKFWRLLKRYNLHEGYVFAKNGESSGMVTFKEPIKSWMRSMENEDTDSDLYADEQALRSKVTG